MFSECHNGKDPALKPTANGLNSPRSFRASNSLRDRSALLGGLTPPASGRSSPLELPLHAPSGHRYADDLESQNDEQLEGLSAKVKLLKDVRARSSFCPWLRCSHVCLPKITIGIGNEVRESTVQLSQMVRLLVPVLWSGGLSCCSFFLPERCFCRDVRCPRRDLPQNEQHG